MPVMAAALTQRAAPPKWNAARLMEYSERHLSLTARSGVSPEAQLASRLLENVVMYRSWEHSHGRLMHAVATAPRQTSPLELRKVTFLTLHRKAPFEYLRDRHITGRARRQLIQALFGGQQSYGRSLVREHEAYVSSACSPTRPTSPRSSAITCSPVRISTPSSRIWKPCTPPPAIRRSCRFCVRRDKRSPKFAAAQGRLRP